MLKNILAVLLLGIALAFLFLAGCKIQIALPKGGNVFTESGSYDCLSGQACTIDVYDTFFDETFIAVAEPGYRFAGWKKRDKGLCGGSDQPCHLLTTFFQEFDALMQILNSDMQFYLTPEFVFYGWDADGDGLKDIDDKYPYGVLSVGLSHTCAITVSGLKCWGSIDSLNRIPDKVRRASQVSAGAQYTCALKDTRVKCWGKCWSGNCGRIEVPTDLVNPRQVSAGYDFTCAIDDSGVRCWPAMPGQNVRAKLENPHQVGVGLGFACALDDSGVHCWGLNDRGQTNVPTLNNPRQLSVGKSGACATHREGVKCWGDANEPWDMDVVNPRQVSAGETNVCAVGELGVSCSGLTVPTDLINPREVRTFIRYTCFLDDSGIKCRSGFLPGSGSYGQKVPPANLVIAR
ncbi:RCC1 domain-containing protein [Pseudomonadota bacterium]